MNWRTFHRYLLCPAIILAALACGLSTTPIPQKQHAEINVTLPASATIPTTLPSTPTRSLTATPLAPMTIVNEACANLVLDTLNAAQDKCSEQGDGSVCLVGAPAEAVPPDIFAQPGDVIPLAGLLQLHTSQVDVTSKQWGAALIRLPTQTSGASASLMLVGDVTLNTVLDTALPAFLVSTSGNIPQCPGAPNALILSTSEEQTFNLTINGVNLEASGATAVVSATLDGEMTIMVLSGSMMVTAQSGSQTLEIGQMTSLTLGGDSALEATTPPSAPIAFDVGQIAFMPFQVVRPPIEILSGRRWTSTGIQLRAGQSFIVMAAGLMKTVDTLPWSSPTGHSAADCAAAGRSDWDCRCRTLADWGTCTLNNMPSMELVGQVGGVQPFIVGAGGVFTARVDGELELGPNDNHFEDNLATYHAIVVVLEQ
jgi:hypothetical protein